MKSLSPSTYQFSQKLSMFVLVVLAMIDYVLPGVGLAIFLLSFGAFYDLRFAAAFFTMSLKIDCNN